MGTDTDINRLAEFKLKQMAAPRANAEPLPGALAETFGEDNIMVDGITIRKVVAGDWIILKQLQSPVYKMQLGDDAKELETTEEENCELIFQFMNPISEVRAMIRNGRTYFTEQALQALVDGKLSDETVANLVKAVTEQFNRYFAIRLKYIQDSQEEGSGKVINFQEQPAQAKQG